MTRKRYNADVRRIRPYLGELIEDDELYVEPGLKMPNTASALLILARIRADLSQAELARRAGVSRSAISAIEHGKRDPGVGYL